jgi:hypothetical protein
MDFSIEISIEISMEFHWIPWNSMANSMNWRNDFRQGCVVSIWRTQALAFIEVSTGNVNSSDLFCGKTTEAGGNNLFFYNKLLSIFQCSVTHSMVERGEHQAVTIKAWTYVETHGT